MRLLVLKQTLSKQRHKHSSQKNVGNDHLNFHSSNASYRSSCVVYAPKKKYMCLCGAHNLSGKNYIAVILTCISRAHRWPHIHPATDMITINLFSTIWIKIPFDDFRISSMFTFLKSICFQKNTHSFSFCRSVLLLFFVKPLNV